MIEYAEWKAAAADENAPEFVKTAGAASADRVQSGPMADIVHDELPCGTAADTWISARAFAKKAESGAYARIPGLKEDIAARLMKSAELFGVADAVSGAMSVKKTSAAERPDSDYGWVDGAERKYPLFSPSYVKRACEYFEEYKYSYPFAMRSAIAKRILAKAAEFGMPGSEIPDGVRKTAGHGLARPDNVINELVVRAESCGDVDAADALAAAAEKVAELGMEALSGGTAEKMAELVEDADVISGAYRSYGRKVMAPEEFLFDIDIKSAEAALADTIEIGGDALSLRKLAELPDELFDGVFGDGFAESCKTAGAIDPAKLGNAISGRPDEDVNELSNVLRGL